MCTKTAFNLIQKEFQKSFFENCKSKFIPLNYEQNLSLNLHISKLNQVKEILVNIIFGKNNKNLQIDSLLKNIQNLFYNKNNYIIWLEKVNNEATKRNEDLEKVIDNNNQKINSLTEKYEDIIIEQKVLSKKYDSQSVEKNILSQKYEDLSIEKKQMQNKINDLLNLSINLQDKIYKVHFTKHLYRAWKRISGAKKYN